MTAEEHNAEQCRTGRWHVPELPAELRGHGGASSPLFARAVRRFQGERGLLVDGKVGPSTLEVCRAASDRVPGTDVSGNNGSLKDAPVCGFRLLADAGLRFVWVKATEDGTYRFRRCEAWRDAARSAGLRVGAYHFARPGVGDARKEAEWFGRSVGRHVAGDLPPVLDVEVNPAGLGPDAIRSWCSEWLSAVEALVGRLPVLYTGTWFWRRAALNVPLWLAQYTSDGREPKSVPGWDWTAWQFSGDSGRVQGLDGAFDRNVLERKTFEDRTR